jgi:hypothetical protein
MTKMEACLMESMTSTLGEQIEEGLTTLHEVGCRELDAGHANCFTCMDYRLNKAMGIAYCRIRSRVIDTLAGYGHEKVLRRKCAQWNGDE